MTLPIDVPTIQQTQEYQDGFQSIQQLLVQSIGRDDVLDIYNPFVQVIACLVALNRYYANHIGDLKDFDQTPFLTKLVEEIGQGIPQTDAPSYIEILRENKRWYGHKTVPALIQFVGDIIGSQIEIEYPQDKILTTDGLMYLDGDLVTQGTEWPQMKIGRIEDSLYWTQYVYVLNILQAQTVRSWPELFQILDSIHPAGMQRYISYQETYRTDAIIPVERGLYADIIVDSFRTTLGNQFPTIDNTFMLDNWTSCLLDEEGSASDLNVMDIEIIPTWFHDGRPVQISESHDYMKHFVDQSRPWICFSRDIQTPVANQVTNEPHTYLTGQTTLTASNNPLASVPTVVNQTSSTTYHHGVDYTIDLDTGVLTWITIPANNDVIHLTYLYYTQQWTTLYPDTDPLLMENVTTNVGMSQYPLGLVSNLTLRQTRYAAYNLDNQNRNPGWIQEVASQESVSVVPQNPFPKTYSAYYADDNDSPSLDVQLAPDGQHLYVLCNDNTISNTYVVKVSTIDGTVTQVSPSLDSNDQPVAMFISPDGTKLYVVQLGSSSDHAKLFVLATSGMTISSTTTIDTSALSVIDTAMSEDGTKIALTTGSKCYILDTSALTVSSFAINSGSYGGGICFPRSDAAHVLIMDSATPGLLIKYDLSGTQIATYTTGAGDSTHTEINILWTHPSSGAIFGCNAPSVLDVWVTPYVFAYDITIPGLLGKTPELADVVTSFAQRDSTTVYCGTVNAYAIYIASPSGVYNVQPIGDGGGGNGGSLAVDSTKQLIYLQYASQTDHATLEINALPAV